MADLLEILRKLGLEKAIKNFEAEKITLKIIPTLKDEDVKRLGVEALGDRIRLRQLCAKAIVDVSNNHAGTSSTTSYAISGDNASQGIKERLNIFAPRRGTSQKRPKKRAVAQRSWTPQFCCLANRAAWKVPTAGEKQALARAGLGLKKIKLDLEDDEETVMNKIVSDTLDGDGQPLGFPRLKGIGGFEMLFCGTNSRTLELLTCARSAKVIRHNIGGSQCKIYLRPIQMDLTLKDDLGHKTRSDLMESCKICDKTFPIDELREHFSSCSDFKTSNADSEDDDTSSDHSLAEKVDEISSNNAPSQATQIADSGMNTNLVTVDLTSDDQQDVSDGQVFDDSSMQDLIIKAVNNTVSHCKQHNIENPCEVLRYAQKEIVYGRPLEVTNPDECLEGDTNFILVDRNNILTTSFDEINNIADLRKTLEVQFYNEAAQDSGGPRKEFFRLVLQKIQEVYFGNELRSDVPDKYTTIGIIFGLSILQNGNIPLFLTEDLIKDIFNTYPVSPCVSNLREGLGKLGIHQIGCEIPTFLYIFRNTSQSTLTYKMITNMLTPKFSEEGTNAEKFEKKIYTFFLKYLREAASGRRGEITLQHILEFVTGTDREPLLGFSIKPSLVFVEASSQKSFLPTANTCINTLIMPRPGLEKPLPDAKLLYAHYDYAFGCSYFGNR